MARQAAILPFSTAHLIVPLHSELVLFFFLFFLFSFTSSSTVSEATGVVLYTRRKGSLCLCLRVFSPGANGGENHKKQKTQNTNRKTTQKKEYRRVYSFALLFFSLLPFFLVCLMGIRDWSL